MRLAANDVLLCAVSLSEQLLGTLHPKNTERGHKLFDVDRQKIVLFLSFSNSCPSFALVQAAQVVKSVQDRGKLTK